MGRYAPEPPFRHGTPARTAILLANLGTPDAPTPGALRRYLAEFLADPRVVEIPRALWLPLLHGVILNLRPRRSAAKYAAIWTPQGSPLLVNTRRQTAALKAWLEQHGHPEVLVAEAMRYGQPSIASVVDTLRAAGVRRLLVLPLYPQYAASTTASVFDTLSRHLQGSRNLPALRLVRSFPDDARYIAALADSVRAHWAAHGRPQCLVMSFHGLPRRSLDLGDPYFCECHQTGRLLAQALGLAEGAWRITFQSRFGKARWLEPYTQPTVETLVRDGARRVDVICPGFVADCLETLEEIGQEVREAFLAAGGERFHYIPCLNDSPAWIEALGHLVLDNLHGWLEPGPDATALADSTRRAAALGAPF